MSRLADIAAFYGLNIGATEAPPPQALIKNSTAPPGSSARAPVIGAASPDFGEARLYTTQARTLHRLAADAGAAGPFTLRAASLAGLAHLERGKSREDDFGLAVLGDRGIAFAVADGVGSTGEAAVSARCAIESALGEVERATLRAKRPMLPPTLEETSERMVELAQALLGRELIRTELQATLLVAVIDRDGVFSALSVGDCQLLVLGREGWRHAGELSQARVANDPGNAMPVGWSEATVVSGKLCERELLVAGTDGFVLALDDPDAASYFAEAWRNPPSLEQFVIDMSFEKLGEIDDRTAACVWFAH